MCWLDAIWYARMWSKHIKCMFGFAFRTYDKKMKLSNCQQIKLTISCTCVCLSIFSVLRFLCFFFSFYFSNIAPCQFLDPRTQKCWEQASKKKISSQVWFQLQRNSIIDWNSKNLKTCELEGDRKKHKYFEFIFSNGILQLFFSPFSFYRVTYILEKFSIRYWTECRA